MSTDRETHGKTDSTGLCAHGYRTGPSGETRTSHRVVMEITFFVYSCPPPSKMLSFKLHYMAKSQQQTTGFWTILCFRCCANLLEVEGGQFPVSTWQASKNCFPQLGLEKLDCPAQIPDLNLTIHLWHELELRRWAKPETPDISVGPHLCSWGWMGANPCSWVTTSCKKAFPEEYVIAADCKIIRRTTDAFFTCTPDSTDMLILIYAAVCGGRLCV